MQIVIICNDDQWEELMNMDPEGIEAHRIDSPREIHEYPQADAVIDLLFENEEARIAMLSKHLPRLIIINSVENTLTETHHSFVRINGWNTFLSSAVIEASANSEELKLATEKLFRHLNKKPEWLPDEPGWITPRVIAMIINEAFLSLEEGVSTRDEIDTAMKLGTNYPFGPFEWAEKIGPGKISSLLTRLSSSHPRYSPAAKLGQA